MKKMKLGLLFSRVRIEEKLLTQAAKRHGGIQLVPLSTNDLVLDFNCLPGVKVVLDRELSQSRALHVLKLLERNGVRAVNSFDTARIGGDKILTSIELQKAGIPTPRIKVAFTPENRRYKPPRSWDTQWSSSRWMGRGGD